MTLFSQDKDMIKPESFPVISKHISYREAIYSETATKLGIENKPSMNEVRRMRMLASRIFEPLRKANDNIPIKINSFYRSPELNEALGGSLKSQHMKGEAFDINLSYYNGGMTNSEAFNYIRDNLSFDQLIWEYGDEYNPHWLHVSCIQSKNRKEVLIKNAQGYTKV